MSRGLALDLSKRNTGVAIFHDGNLTQARQWSYQEHDYFGHVLRRFEADVLNQLSFGYDWVAYEEVRPRNKYHMEQHFGMVGILAMRASQHEIPLFGVNTLSMRKIVLGKGNIIKDDVLRLVRDIVRQAGWSVDVPNHDVADAICVGLWVLQVAEK